MSAAFRFRLDTVLRVRRLEEERAKELLALATREVARRAASLREAAAVSEALPTVLEPMEAEAFFDFRERAGRLAETVVGARQALAGAVREHDLARQQAVAARQRVATLERLADKRYREWLDERERDEIRAVDDVVSARAAARRMGRRGESSRESSGVG